MIFLKNKEYESTFRKVGLKIAYYRKLQGYTQETFSEKLKISVSYYSQIEAAGCYKPISLRTLFKIAETLDVDPYKLLMFD
ncbi:MAG: helix-turn-helix transcriptional regulator [Oscillospiraceae bacterium]|nr:helix-turn-helix transcriptional regulator [Oscillospiraceae bacterium]